MTNKELKQVLKKHRLWLEDKCGGRRADLLDAILRCADLCDANLRNANLCSADLRCANLRCADLCNANLRYADLCGADLRNANLRGADIDFASFPLWCGGLDVHLDDRQLAQLAYHLVRNGLFSKNASRETKAELLKIVDFANKFHRVEECGRIEVEE